MKLESKITQCSKPAEIGCGNFLCLVACRCISCSVRKFLGFAINCFQWNLQFSLKSPSKNRFFHSRLYSIYSHSIVILYSFHSHSIVNLYSSGLHLGIIRRSSVVYLSFCSASEYSQYILIQTYSIVFRLENPIALHLGRPPPFPISQ